MVKLIIVLKFKTLKLNISCFFFLCAGRDELLTEHVLAWNRRKIIGMVKSLCQRYSRVGAIASEPTIYQGDN